MPAPVRERLLRFCVYPPTTQRRSARRLRAFYLTVNAPMNEPVSRSPFRSPPAQRKRFSEASGATRRMRRLLGSLAIVCLAVYLLVAE